MDSGVWVIDEIENVEKIWNISQFVKKVDNLHVLVIKPFFVWQILDFSNC